MPHISIYGKIEIDQDIDPDKEQSIAFKRTACRNVVISKADNSKHYKMENLDKVTIIEDYKAIEGSKDEFKRKLRARMWMIHNDEGIAEDFEQWRDKFKKKIILYLDQIHEFLNNKH